VATLLVFEAIIASAVVVAFIAAPQKDEEGRECEDKQFLSETAS